ncbi:hypothetical protein SCLO_1023230 [Sphingobium cloacae]|uniref:Uncharacterized protein n=2 Tax=Sphingobium cloacae TaxID=120107 RepID=A0A1E1F4B2_9SPHN|nr:hypothetical protein SCLO_1023230 [Sphingobium cloacae]
MQRRVFLHSLTAAAIFGLAVPARAASGWDLLTEAAYRSPSTARARVLLSQARTDAAAALRQNPANQEAAIQQAVAAAWGAMLSGGIGPAREARRLIQAQITAQPNNAEAHLAMGAWHIEAVRRVGMLAGPTVGASRKAGNAALDRAIALGGRRALPSAYATLLRAASGEGKCQNGRAAVLALARRAAQGTAPTSLDAVMRASAQRFVVTVAAPSANAADAAAPLLPFAHLSGKS